MYESTTVWRHWLPTSFCMLFWWTALCVWDVAENAGMAYIQASISFWSIKRKFLPNKLLARGTRSLCTTLIYPLYLPSIWVGDNRMYHIALTSRIWRYLRRTLHVAWLGLYNKTNTHHNLKSKNSDLHYYYSMKLAFSGMFGTAFQSRQRAWSLAKKVAKNEGPLHWKLGLILHKHKG